MLRLRRAFSCASVGLMRSLLSSIESGSNTGDNGLNQKRCEDRKQVEDRKTEQRLRGFHRRVIHDQHAPCIPDEPDAQSRCDNAVIEAGKAECGRQDATDRNQDRVDEDLALGRGLTGHIRHHRRHLERVCRVLFPRRHHHCREPAGAGRACRRCEHGKSLITARNRFIGFDHAAIKL